MTLPFENRTGSITRKIASAQLKHDRLKKWFTIFSIAMTTSLLSVVLLLASGIITVNRNGGNGITGSYHTLISGISQEQFDKLRAEERIRLLGLNAPIGSFKMGEQILNVSYSDAEALTLNGLSVSGGKMPVLENEIIIEKEYLLSQNIDAGIGDKISLPTPNKKDKKDFIISGYLKTAAKGTDRALYAAIVSKQYFDAMDGWNAFSVSAMYRIKTDAASNQSEIEHTAAAVAKSAGIERTPFINKAYIELSQPSFLLIAAAIGGLAIVIASGILVIYCIFYLSILNSIKEYGQMRTIGMTKKQIKRLVSREGYVLSCIAIPIGLVMGTILSYALIPQGFTFGTIIWVWPLVMVLVYITVRLSIRKPAIIAAAVSPIEAYRYDGNGNSIRGKKTFGPKRSTIVMLARKQILRYRKENALTISSLVITGILLFGLSSVLSSMNAEDMSLSGFPRGQFSISFSFQELNNTALEKLQMNSPFTEELYDALSKVTGTEKITTYHYLQASKELQASNSDMSIVSYDQEDMELIRGCSPNAAIPDYDTMASQKQLIVGKPNSFEEYFNTQAEVGKSVILKVFDGDSSQVMEFKIAGILDENKIGINSDKIDILMLPIDAMNQISNYNTTNQYTIRVTDHYEKQSEKEIEQILENKTGLTLDTLSAAIAQNSNFIQGMKFALFVAVVFIGCFAVMNLTNTILTGIITRQKEFSVLRSVGMTKKQLTSMVCYEGLITTTKGLFLALVIGGGIGYLLCSILKNGLMNYLNYKFPFGAAATYCIILLLSTLIVTGAAIKHQNR